MTDPRRPLLRFAGVLLVCGFLRAQETAAPNPRVTGTPLMRVWRPEDYGAAPVNWRIVQHPGTRFIYVANNSGVLEFDGATWRIIPMPRGGAARTIFLDGQGRVWAGGIGELARLEPDGNGRLQALDLTEQVAAGATVSAATADADDPGPSAVRARAAEPLSGLGTLNRAAASDRDVFVRLPDTIAHFRGNDPPRLIPAAGRVGMMWWMDDALHVEGLEGSMMRLSERGLERVSGVGRLGAYEARRDSDGWQLLTAQGIRFWPGPGQPAVASPEFERVVRDESVFSAVFLRDGRIAYGTTRSGVVVFGADGRLQRRIDRTHGLPANHINSLAEDSEGGLWVASHNGLARIQLGAPYVVHGVAQGISGGPRHLVRSRDRILVAHSEGFSWRDDRDGRFHAVGGFSGGSHRAIPWGEGALVTAVGLHEVTRADVSKRTVAPTLYWLGALRDRPDWVLASSALALRYFQRQPDGGWRQEGQFRNVPAGVDDLCEMPGGFLWAVTRAGELHRIDLRDGLRANAPAQLYGAERGVPRALRRDGVRFIQLGRDLLVSSAVWLLRYDPAADRFVPETRFPGLFEAGDFAHLAVPGSDGGAWFYVGGASPYFASLHPDGAGWKLGRRPAPELSGMLLNHFFDDHRTRTLWLAGQGTLLSIDLDWKDHVPVPPVQTVIRRVLASDGDTAADQPATGARLALPAGWDSLRFEFAAPTFRADYLGRGETRYRTRLAGFDRHWTGWSTASYRDFTNLPARSFTFAAQAMDFTGRVSPPATLTFAIAPPWWLTPWAFGGFALLAAGGVTGLVRLRTRAQRRRADRLEQVVVARTAELAEKNSALATQNIELVQLRRLETMEKIAARLAEEKARLEMLRYQLNPHFLFNALTSICSQLSPASGGARSTIERLTDFCQLTLFRPEGDENPTLADELKMLRAYLDIEQTRWGELLSVEIDCDPAVQSLRVPSLLLLPLVENALKYGRATNPGAMTIRIAARAETERDGRRTLVLAVANTGEWIEDDNRGSVPSLGIGHENLRQRLQRYYPNAHAFATDTHDGWVRVTLRLALQLGSKEQGAGSKENDLSAAII